MFKLGPAAYWWPVEVFTPADGGQVERSEFAVQFRYLDTEAHGALLDEVRTQQLGDPAFCRRVMTGFRDVAMPDGSMMAYSDDNLALLLRQPGVATAITKAYFASRNPDDPEKEPARGNSARPPAGGRVAASETSTKPH